MARSICSACPSSRCRFSTAPREIVGYRFGRAAYLTDHSDIPDSSLPLLRDLDVLFLDALRREPHPMHTTVDRALAWVEELKPTRAFFTHICHDLAHEETNAGPAFACAAGA